MKYEGQKIIAVVDTAGPRGELGQKALLPLGERPLLWHLIERLQAVESIDEIVVVVTSGLDEEVVDLLQWLDEASVQLFRALPGEDLLSRLYSVLLASVPDVVVPMGVDRPLFALEYLEEMIALLIDQGLDAVDGAPEKTGITPGMESTVLRAQALVDAHLLALDPRQREEASRFILQRPQAFQVAYFEAGEELRSGLKLVIDDREDYERMRSIYRALYRPGEAVVCRQVVEWLTRRAVA